MAFNRKFGYTEVSFPKLVAQSILRTIVAAILTLIIYMSITFVVTGFNYTPLGYNVLYSEDGTEFETVYTYMYTGEEDENWVDEKLAEYMDKEHYYKQDIPNKLSKSAMNTIGWITQIMSLIIWGGLIYVLNWNAGNALSDKKELGGTGFDKFLGVKVGLVSVIPFAITYLILVVTKLSSSFDWAVSLFKILNYNCFAFVNMMITSGLKSISISELVCLALVLLPLPLFATFGFAMGVRHTNIKDKIVYQNEEAGE